MKKTTLFFILFLLIQNLGFSQKFEMLAPDLKFEIKQIAIIGEQLRINFLVTNTGVDRNISFGIVPEISMYDDQGNAYEPKEVSICNDGYSKTLIKGIPSKGQILFVGTASARKIISMLDINYRFDGKDVKMQFRDLPIPYQFDMSPNPKVRNIEENSLLKITGIFYDGKNIMVNTVITNNGDDAEMRIGFEGRVIDNEGNEYSCKGGDVGEDKSNGLSVRKKFIQDIPVKASFIYSAPSKPLTLALLELFINDNKFIFKNLDVR